MGLKTYKGQDNEGYIHGSKQEGFNERRAQERQRQEDRNELNRADVRGTVKGNERL